VKIKLLSPISQDHQQSLECKSIMIIPTKLLV